MGRRMQLDATGRCRSTATSRDIDDRIPPSNGRRYPADPATRPADRRRHGRRGETPQGLRMRGLIAVLWRAGLRIREALMLVEADLEPRRGSLLVRHAKGGKPGTSIYLLGG